MDTPLLITVVGVGGTFLGGIGGAVVTWVLHRPAEVAQTAADRADADAAETKMALDRASINDKLRDRLDRQDQVIEELRSTADELRATIDALKQELLDQATAHRRDIDARDERHRKEIADRDQLNGRQQLVLAQQAEEIKGLKAQVASMSRSIEQWQEAARDGRDALREALLGAVTPPPTLPTSSGGA